ncbi:Prenyltransferase, beta subunit [Dethiosulfatibacter aminovorans DSM 17477]|uniref:Prenyltransferase, beta subunit n=1 Tax=Dethiosulfatibacter aminovorans DSM 17477 TaxID=1121476 RepID=A0A1M6BP76_9FIRM|nr:S-layer homology domain-containing protein [Dethiosulfatibacter aminovorans]SHI50338.1 Prenyltransferase, beta subunit [Dethiosulfatibacter aminovorans DSM 17477]
MKISRFLICIVLVMVVSLVPFNHAYGYESDEMGESAEMINDAVGYLNDMQNSDGGFPAKAGRDSSVALTCWSVMALEAAGENIESGKWKPEGDGPIEYILSADYEPEDTVDYVRILLALSAAERSSQYQGYDLEEKVESFQQPNGHFGQPDRGEDQMINAHMWSVLSLESVGNRDYDRDKAREWLVASQNDDGGFGWLVGGESDTDDTGIAISTLVLLGEDRDSAVIQDALDYIKSRQENDGGISASDMMGNDSNSASDAWSMQGLIAAGEDYDGSYWTVGNENVKTHLMSLQASDGSFDWKDGVSSSPVKMTAYVIAALSEKPYPVNVDYSELESEAMFTDLSREHWAYDSIACLVGQGIVNGYPDGTFMAEGSVKRAEFTSMAVKGLDMGNDSYGSYLTFKDVPGSLWSYRYVAIAYKEGIIKGRSSEVFDPDGLINGAELATMLVNIMPDEKKADMEEGQYWYSGYVSLADGYGLLYPGFKASEPATRAQCAYSIKKILDFIK